MAGDAASAAPKQRQRGKPFQKGVSGNPAGRKAGSRNRATLALEALIEGQGEAIVNAVIEKAKAGDTTAQRVLMDRLVPVRRDRPARFAMPTLVTPLDAPAAIAAILDAVAAGELPAGEAVQLAELVNAFLTTCRAIGAAPPPSTAPVPLGSPPPPTAEEDAAYAEIMACSTVGVA